MDKLLRFSPPAWTLYPFLFAFLLYGVWQGMWQACLENAVISDAHAAGEIAAIIEYVPDRTKQLKAIGDIKI